MRASIEKTLKRLNFIQETNIYRKNGIEVIVTDTLIELDFLGVTLMKKTNSVNLDHLEKCIVNLDKAIFHLSQS